ncbi:di-heme-cytochrome C peroxidase [Rhodobacteraceae bacterium]|nr:di-heme-cytochrome C peroxidase [Paracoccaceae bacterium]
MPLSPILFVSLFLLASGVHARDLTRVWTDQGWSSKPAAAAVWYEKSQGSRLMRADWFDVLMDTDPMFTDQAMDRVYGYPSMATDAKYPIGFVLDRDTEGRDWIGLNCSACHTSRLIYDNQEIMVHGGQAMGDFRTFLQDLVVAVEKVAATPASQSDFLAKLPVNGGYPSLAAFQSEITEWLDHRREIDRVSTALDDTQEWGPGRADAVSYIHAATARVVQTQPAQQIAPANAPVNYPPAWNANQQGALQYNGLVYNGSDLSLLDNNVKLGAYIRNWTEALGVFAHAKMDDDGTLTTSINGPALLEIEKSLATLQSPLWPEHILGEIDKDLAETGRDIYDQNCASCHALVDDITDLEQPYDLSSNACKPARTVAAHPFVCLQPVVDFSVTTAARQSTLEPSPSLIGTDPMETCNIMLHQIPTGKLEGLMKKNTFHNLDGLGRFPDVDFTNQVLAALIIKDLGNQWSDLVAAQAQTEVSILFDVVKTWIGLDAQTTAGLYSSVDEDVVDKWLTRCADSAVMLNAVDDYNFPLPAYKARPLNGIWASAPYLHNGSVPSIADLLLPPHQRPKTFAVPMGDFDVDRIGLAQNKGGFEFWVTTPKGDPVIGNSNLGHDYGTDLSPEEKAALIEFVKGL